MKFSLLAMAWILAVSGRAEVSEAAAKLQVGRLTISEYEVNKIFTSQLAGKRKPRNRESLEEWFRAYTDQLIATARAKDLGYFDAPAVVDNVYRMERNVLSSATFLLPAFFSGDLASWVQQETEPEIVVVSRVVIARKADVGARETQREDLFAEALKQTPLSYQRGALLHEMDCSEEARRQLEAVPVGECVVEPLPEGRLAYWRKDSVFPVEARAEVARFFSAAASSPRSPFLLQWRQYVDSRVQGFEIDEGVLAQEGERMLAALSARSDEAREDGPFDLPVASYRLSNRLYRVPFAAIMDYQRRLFFRRPIRALDELRAQVAAFVVEDFTYHSSLSFGLHRQEKAQRDRVAYRHGMILDAYLEKEIDPLIDLSDAALRPWYEANRARFKKAEYVEANVYLFENREAALAAAQTLQSSRLQPAQAAEVTLKSLRERRQKARILHDDPRLEPDFLRPLWIAPVGHIFSAVAFTGKMAVVEKLGAGGEVIESLEVARKDVIREVRNERRAVLLKEHAARFASAYPISIDPELQIKDIGRLVASPQTFPVKLTRTAGGHFE